MEKIQIQSITGRIQQPSKNNPDQTYTITRFIDMSGRQLSSIGKETESWQNGQMLEGTITPRNWVDRNGVTQVSYNFGLPKKSGSGPRNFWPNAYEVASLYLGANKETYTLLELDSMAVQMKTRLENGPMQSNNQGTLQVATHAPTYNTPKPASNIPIIETGDEGFNEDIGF